MLCIHMYIYEIYSLPIMLLVYMISDLTTWSWITTLDALP